MRDYVVPWIGKISAGSALDRLDVDRAGLDELDRRILELIWKKFRGGPVGIGTIAAAVGEERDTIEEIHEPYLMQIGFLERTPRGRRVTRRAVRHLEGGTAAQDICGAGKWCVR